MERIFYKSDTTDAYTGYPIYVFDTSYLPSTDVINYDLFIPTMMRSLPHHPYVVIMFSGGLNKILWIWGIKFLKSFLADSGEHTNVENLQKVIAVHESWFVKSITQILTNFSISKNTLSKLNSLFDSRKNSHSLLTSCDSLGELSDYVDITKLKLSLNIYKHDAQVTTTTTINMSCPGKPIINNTTKFLPKSDPIFYHHFYQLFHIVDTYGHKVELLFHKPGNRLNTDILFMCMLRNQLLWINDWDLHCIASCFKKILMEMPNPLLPVDMITLPMKDSIDYGLVVFNRILAVGSDSGADAVLFQCLDLCRKIVDHHETTKHTYVTILRSICHAFTHELISHTNKDRISVAVRFIKSLLVNWTDIRPLYQKRFKSVFAIVNGEDLNDATIDELYNMSHDITMEANDSTQDDSFHGEQNFDILSGTSEVLLDSTTSKSHNIVSSLSLANLSNQSSRELVVTTKMSEIEQIPEIVHEVTLEKESHSSSAPKLSSESPRKESGDLGQVRKTYKVSEVSNVLLQFPPQKYKFERVSSVTKFKQAKQEEPRIVKKPVVRGRKVSELTKLFEERSQAMDLLRTI